jgi:hypothetical protein
MRISKLSLLTLVIFLFFVAYKFLAPKGICNDIDLLMCNYYMDSNVRIGYFFLVFTCVSLVVDNFFLGYRRSWLVFALISIIPIFWALIKINSGVLHADLSSGSGLGWASILDDFVDKVATLAVYVLFVIGSAITIFLSWKKTKKPNAKSK